MNNILDWLLNRLDTDQRKKLSRNSETSLNEMEREKKATEQTILGPQSNWHTKCKDKKEERNEQKILSDNNRISLN